MSVTTNFSNLDGLRPSSATFGEVVSIRLFVVENEALELIGCHKRKSIHCPARVNAYWNFVGLRSELIQWFSRKGVQRPLRSWMTYQLNSAVRACHQRELEATYSAKYDEVQYYDVVIRPSYKGFKMSQDSKNSGFNAATTAVFSTSEVEQYPEGTNLEVALVSTGGQYRILR